MVFSIIILDLHLSSRSLKEKRHILKPLLNRLHKEFNVSAAELDRQDLWHVAIVGCALLTNEKEFAGQLLSKIPGFINKSFPDIQITNYSIQYL